MIEACGDKNVRGLPFVSGNRDYEPVHPSCCKEGVKEALQSSKVCKSGRRSYENLVNAC
jgi:hypothetical protein